MSHGEKGVIEDAGWISPVLSTDQQHALQQRHKFSPVGLLRLHVAGIETQNQVHLMGAKQQMSGRQPWASGRVMVTRDGRTHVCYVVKAAENIFPGLFGFKSSLFLMLFCGLERTFRFMNTHKYTNTPTHTHSFCSNKYGKYFQVVNLYAQAASWSSYKDLQVVKYNLTFPGGFPPGSQRSSNHTWSENKGTGKKITWIPDIDAVDNMGKKTLAKEKLPFLPVCLNKFQIMQPRCD